MTLSTQISFVAASIGFMLGGAGILFWEVTHTSLGGWATFCVYAVVCGGALVVPQFLSRRHRSLTVFAYFMAIVTTLAVHTSVLAAVTA